MEHIGRLLARSGSGGKCLNPEQLSQAAWYAAVGKRVARRTNAVSLVQSRLVVEVEDEVWQQQLTTLRAQILAKIAEVIGPGQVTGLEFRVFPRRRFPRRELAPVRGAAAAEDEADRIADPVLSKLYKAARKRARA